MKKNNATNIYRYGKGKPTYVVNGGPGLDFTYLIEPFESLTDFREIIFYDQIGTGKEFDIAAQPSASDLVNQLIDLINQDNRHKDIIAHSWGTYLVLSALYNDQVNDQIDNIILVNPFALDYCRYQQSGERLLQRFPKDIFPEIERLNKNPNKESYAEMMQLIAPFYTHSPNTPFNFVFETYNSAIEDSVYKSIEGFNHIPILSKIKGNLYVIECDDDFISEEDTIELQHYSKEYVMLSECGHFPFIEKKEKFLQAISNFLNC